MKTKKMNVNETEVLHAMAELARLIPPTAGLVIEPGRHNVPRVPVRKLVSLGTALEARRPASLQPHEEEALGELRAAIEIGERKVALDRMEEAEGARDIRAKVVSLATGLTGMLDGLAAAPSVIAERAGRARHVLFGAETGIARMNPLDLWMEIERVRKVVTAKVMSPAEQALVPAEMLDELFAANQKLGRTLGMYGTTAVLAHLDNKVLILFLRRRIARWVTCVLSTAKEESLASMQRALTALAPIDELRADLARKRSASAADDDGGEHGDEANEDGDAPVVDRTPTATATANANANATTTTTTPTATANATATTTTTPTATATATAPPPPGGDAAPA